MVVGVSKEKIQASSLGLKKVDLLQGLPPERLEAIGRQCAWRNHDAGAQLAARDADDRDLHLIVSGAVRVTSYSVAGREISFRDLHAGTCYGELSAIDGRPRSADVIALAPSLIASLPRADFLELLRQEWVVNERVLQRLSDLVRRLTDRVVEVSTLTVQRRLCGELLRLAGAAGATGATGADGNQARIDPAPRHAEMASQVSTYREQVTRELSALVRAGVLAKDGRALLVLDLARLQALANG